nr:ATP-binding protein [uncultured Prevotella sp.]
MAIAKRVPYGVSNFKKIIKFNQYYVDKTMYIPMLEDQPDYLIFIRPRRFGKSLFLSMLETYYDCNLKDQFKELFGELWIGSHPTPLQGEFQVLTLDFSQVGGDIEHLEENFNSYCGFCFDSFMRRYKEYYGEKVAEQVYAETQSHNKLAIIQKNAAEKGYPLYLIIDEYDNFTNTVLNELGEEVYHAMTHASGFYRDYFKKFKGSFDKIFMMGVSPVTLDDVTSGFNIGWNISTKPKFDKMLGFSTEDVREMFTKYREAEKIPADSDVEAMIEEIKPWYDNYCFAEECLKSDVRVFNCDMVLYYLRNYMDYGCAPKQMIDPNTKTDYNKMKKLLQLDILDGDRKGVINKIAEEGEIVTSLYQTFSAIEMTKPEVFPSLLFYYGMLTIKQLLGDQLVLGIPNNNVRKQYYTYLLEQYQAQKYIDINRVGTLLTNMAFDGKWEPVLSFISKAYENVSAVRDGIEAERNLQGFFMAYLYLSSYYIIAPELELSHGFCDFFMLPDLTHYPIKHSYIIELKVLGKQDTEVKAETQWQEAIEQINRYAAAPRVEVLRQGTTLHKIIIQFKGGKLKRIKEV